MAICCHSSAHIVKHDWRWQACTAMGDVVELGGRRGKGLLKRCPKLEWLSTARVAMADVVELLEAAEAKAYYGLAINWKPLQALTQALLDRGVLQVGARRVCVYVIVYMCVHVEATPGADAGPAGQGSAAGGGKESVCALWDRELLLVLVGRNEHCTRKTANADKLPMQPLSPPPPKHGPIPVH
eukprot:1139547-Pelagomonas_calceolata.AAC.18